MLALVASCLAGRLAEVLSTPLLVLITCFPLIYWLLSAFGLLVIVSLHELISLFALIMFFIVGWFITPVLARAFADQGQKLRHRVQHRIEAIKQGGVAMNAKFTARCSDCLDSQQSAISGQA